MAVTKDSHSQISNKCPPGLHFFPPQIHPECSLSRRKQDRPGESSSCVCRSPGPGHPGIPPPSGSHVLRKASPSCLGSLGFPRVGLGTEPWGWGWVYCCISLHKQATTLHPTSSSLTPPPQHQPKLPLSFLKQLTTNVQLNYTKMTSHTSEKNV